MTKFGAVPGADTEISPVGHVIDGLGSLNSRTVTRIDLAEAVYRCVGLSRKESACLVQTVLNELADTLAEGETVKLSSFGSFVVRAKSERIGRNPKTGIEVPITQRRVLVFKPSSVLKARVNGQSLPNEDC
jgi:integration host factor subunit alpha